jgi:hypothetical protein
MAGLRLLTMLTPDELHLLRSSPYESPTTILSARQPLFRTAMQLVKRGLLEHDVERVQFRVTDLGAELARPLSVAEARRHAARIRKARPDERETLLVHLLARACVEVALVGNGDALAITSPDERRADEVAEIAAETAAKVG